MRRPLRFLGLRRRAPSAAVQEARRLGPGRTGTVQEGTLREYEFTFVVQPEISEEGLETLCKKLEGALERGGATRLFYEDWGRRRLAYEIQKFQKGHYMVLHFLDGGTVVPELERVARIEDSVLRFLTVLGDDDVSDIESRKSEAVGLEEERKKKAAERAARDAEEAAARAAEASSGPRDEDDRDEDDRDRDRDPDTDSRQRRRDEDEDEDEE